MTTPSSHSVEEQLKTLLDRISAYVEQFHGGSVEFVSFEKNKKRFESDLYAIPGFGPNIVEQIVSNWPKFIEFVSELPHIEHLYQISVDRTPFDFWVLV